jgi:hypothetical protein
MLAGRTTDGPAPQTFTAGLASRGEFTMLAAAGAAGPFTLLTGAAGAAGPFTVFTAAADAAGPLPTTAISTAAGIHDRGKRCMGSVTFRLPRRPCVDSPEL